MMHAQLRKPLTLLGSALAAGALVASFNTTAADAAVTKAEAAQHCAVLVGKSVNGAASPVLARACGTSAADARAKMFQASAEAGVKPASARAITRLMTWYWETNYEIKLHAPTDIYGSDGTCDSGGYRLEPSYEWSHNLSSARGYSKCNLARFTNIAGSYASTFALPVKYLGSRLNDNVGSIWVYNDA